MVTNRYLSKKTSSILTEADLLHAGSSFQILGKLAEGTRLSDVEVAVAKRLIENEYVAQYTGRAKGEAISPPFSTWSIPVFRSFLEKIEWTFGQQSNDEIESEALGVVRESPYFDHRHEGLEIYLLAAITDLLEKRSHSSSAVERIVGPADIKNIFLEILAQQREDRIDPAHREWEHEPVTDKRNLSDKVLAVAPNYPMQRLSRLARKIALARHEKDAYGKEYVSLQLRVLNACQDELEQLSSVMESAMSDVEVDDCLTALVNASVMRMSDLSSTWTYQIADEEAIRGAVLTLFDDCYLAFDNA